MTSQKIKVVILILVFIVLGFKPSPVIASSFSDEDSDQNDVKIQSASYLLGEEVQISTPSAPVDADRNKPVVVFNSKHREYLVVWHNTWPGGHRDIYAQRLSETGKRIGSWFAITAGPNDRFQPTVAYNAASDEYLIVWMYNANGDGNTYEIWGRIISWNNSYQKPEFRIINWVNRSFWTPRVVWNNVRNEYMVVWNAFNTSGGFPGVPNDIGGYRISASGNVINPGSPIVFIVADLPHQVDITFNPVKDEYFLVFTVVHSQLTTGNDIYALRASWNGTPINPPGLIKVHDIEKDQNHAAVSTNNTNRYMVVWEHAYTSNDRDIYGREYNTDGNPMSDSFIISNWSQDETAPDIASSESKRDWLAVWQTEIASGYSIYCRRWGESIALYYFAAVDYAFVEAKNPIVATNSPGFLIVYEEKLPDPTMSQHIYGRRWWPVVDFLPFVRR